MSWDPIRLAAHLEDYHGLHPAETNGIDGDDMRRLHVELHAQGRLQRPHVHELGDPRRPVAPAS